MMMQQCSGERARKTAKYDFRVASISAPRFKRCGTVFLSAMGQGHGGVNTGHHWPFFALSLYTPEPWKTKRRGMALLKHCYNVSALTWLLAN